MVLAGYMFYRNDLAAIFPKQLQVMLVNIFFMLNDLVLIREYYATKV